MSWIVLEQFNLLKSQTVYQSKTVRCPDLTGKLYAPEGFCSGVFALILSIGFCTPETKLLPQTWKTHIGLPLHVAEIFLTARDVDFFPVARFFFPFGGMAV